MNDLIERIEAASKGSRALDWEIHVHDGIDGKGMYGPHPRYSFSIDAALTLVPEGWIVAQLGQGDDGSWFCELRAGHRTSYRRVAMSPVKCPTPALALCAAVLKARAYLKETNNAD